MIHKAKSNPLLTHFEHNSGRLIHKWMHYFDIYHRHFAPYRKKPVTIVEFGVYHGGSLQMWKKYFGRKARIIGVDINPACKELEESQIKIYIGDQEDRSFLRKLKKDVGPIDIVIEDGGHTMGQQITTFEEMFPAVREGGLYLVEDLHTSYWSEYGGGIGKKNTFIEYSKNIIDQVNAFHARDKKRQPLTQLSKTVAAMHVYDSIIVFDKGNISKPTVRKTGKESFVDTYAR